MHVAVSGTPGGQRPPQPSDERVWTAGPCRLRIGGRHVETVRAIVAQLGARPAPAAEGPPDLTIEVGSLPRGPRRLFGAGDYAATDDEFVLLRGSQKRPVEVTLPFDRLGQSPLLRCTPGSAPLPLLVPVVNLSILARGVLPVHAAAFDHEGLGVLVTGWSKSGKTETLLAFGQRGARYVGDEWTYLHEDGTLSGLQEPMRLWSWHVAQLGRLGDAVSARTRTRLGVLDLLTAGGARVDARLPGMARRLRYLLREQRHVRVPPRRIVEVADRTQVGVVVLTESHDQPTIEVRETSSTTVAQRVATMLPVERAALLTAYRAFRYAFPDRRSELLEDAERHERVMATARLKDVPCLLVRHPYPFEFDAMARALTPWLDRYRA